MNTVGRAQASNGRAFESIVTSNASVQPAFGALPSSSRRTRKSPGSDALFSTLTRAAWRRLGRTTAGAAGCEASLSGRVDGVGATEARETAAATRLETGGGLEAGGAVVRKRSEGGAGREEVRSGGLLAGGAWEPFTRALGSGGGVKVERESGALPSAEVSSDAVGSSAFSAVGSSAGAGGLEGGAVRLSKKAASSRARGGGDGNRRSCMPLLESEPESAAGSRNTLSSAALRASANVRASSPLSPAHSAA